MPVSLPESIIVRKKIRTTIGSGIIWAPAIFLLTTENAQIILTVMSINVVKKTKADAYSFWCSSCKFEHPGECPVAAAPAPARDGQILPGTKWMQENYDPDTGIWSPAKLGSVWTVSSVQPDADRVQMMSGSGTEVRAQRAAFTEKGLPAAISRWRMVQLP
jgi:hypothetical protein